MTIKRGGRSRFKGQLGKIARTMHLDNARMAGQLAGDRHDPRVAQIAQEPESVVGRVITSPWPPCQVGRCSSRRAVERSSRSRRLT